MRAFPLLCALALAGSAWAQPQQQPQKVDLRPLWKVGQASRYRIVQTEQTVAQMRGLGEPQKSTTQIEAVVAWEVLEIQEAGGGTARMSIESIQFKITDAQGRPAPSRLIAPTGRRNRCSSTSPHSRAQP